MLNWGKNEACNLCAIKDEQIEHWKNVSWQASENSATQQRSFLEVLKELEKWAAKIRAHNDHNGLNAKYAVALKENQRLEKVLEQRDDHIEKLTRLLDLYRKDDLQSDFLAKIKDENFPVRLKNALTNHEIKTYADLMDMSSAQVLCIPNLGRRSFWLLKKHLQDKFGDRCSYFKMLEDQK